MNIHSIPANQTQKVQRSENARLDHAVRFNGNPPDNFQNTKSNTQKDLPLKQRLKSAALNGGGAALASTAIGIWLPIPLNITIPLAVGALVSGIVMVSPGAAVERWGKTFKYRQPQEESNTDPV